jgi:hypothetical protein
VVKKYHLNKTKMELNTKDFRLVVVGQGSCFDEVGVLTKFA